MGLDGTDNRQAAPVARRCPNPPSGAPEPGRAQRLEGEAGAVAASAAPGCTTPPPQTSRSAHSGRSEALDSARRARHRRRPWRTGPAARKKENERGGGGTGGKGACGGAEPAHRRRTRRQRRPGSGFGRDLAAPACPGPAEAAQRRAAPALRTSAARGANNEALVGARAGRDRDAPAAARARAASPAVARRLP